MTGPASRPTRARLLEITSYPPPRAGWGVRVEYLKRALEAAGHECVVLNIGTSRRIPSAEYECVENGWTYVAKVVRFCARGFTPHIHVNGTSPKGFALSFIAAFVSVLWGRRPFLTFHAGVDQVFFPRAKAPAWTPVFWLLFVLPRRIICNNEAVKEKIVEYGVSPRKVVPIPAFSTQYLDGRAAELPDQLRDFYAGHTEVVFTYIRVRPEFYPLELVKGFSQVAAVRPTLGLVLCGTSGHMDGELSNQMSAELDRCGIRSRVAIVDDLDHDSFLAALSRARVYLRTPATDGVASSVLEALSLGVPVVASENGNRPAGVICYPATDWRTMSTVLATTLDRRDQIAAALPRPVVRNTLQDEIALLTDARSVLDGADS